MAKNVEVKVWQESPTYFTLIEKTVRPLIKGCVCYQNNLYKVESGRIIIPDDGYPWVAEPFDTELERLLGWFCTNHKKVEESLGIKGLFICDEGVFGRKRSELNEKLAITQAIAGLGSKFLP